MNNHLPTFNNKLKVTHNNLLLNFEKLRTGLQMDDAEWSDVTHLSSDQYVKILQRRNDLPLMALLNLSEYLNLNPEMIIEGDLDFPTLLAHRNTNYDVIPERYSTAAFSRMRSIKSMVQYVETFLGWQKKNILLRTFQLTELSINDPNRPVSIRLAQDIFKYLRHLGLSSSQISSLGEYSVAVNRNLDVGQEFSKCIYPSVVFERMFTDLLKYYEKNSIYQILYITDVECLLEIRPNEEACAALNSDKVGNTECCHYRAGVFASAPGFLGLPFAKVEEISCIHLGESSCKFLINYECSENARLFQAH